MWREDKLKEMFDLLEKTWKFGNTKIGEQTGWK